MDEEEKLLRKVELMARNNELSSVISSLLERKKLLENELVKIEKVKTEQEEIQKKEQS